MPQSAQRVLSPPQFVLADAAQWVIDTDGVFLLVHGPGCARLGLRPEDLVGQSIEQVYVGRDDLQDVVRDALRGIPFEGMVEFRGVIWLVQARPLEFPGQGIVAVACVGHALDQPPPPTGPEPARDVEPGVEIYEAMEDNAKFGIWSGDRLIVRDGRSYVAQFRYRSCAEFEELRAADTTRFHLLHSTRPRLRLL